MAWFKSFDIDLLLQLPFDHSRLLILVSYYLSSSPREIRNDFVSTASTRIGILGLAVVHGAVRSSRCNHISRAADWQRYRFSSQLSPAFLKSGNNGSRSTFSSGKLAFGPRASMARTRSCACAVRIGRVSQAETGKVTICPRARGP